jgi:hypothetical protein
LDQLFKGKAHSVIELNEITFWKEAFVFNAVAEGHWSVYAIALAIGLFVGLIAKLKDREPWWGVLVTVVLLGLCFAVSKSLETTREQMAKVIINMAEAGTKGDFPRILEGVSPQFRHPSIGSGADLIEYLKRWKGRIPNMRVAVWEFEITKATPPHELEFMFKAEDQTGRPYMARIRAIMVLDRGKWKMTGLRMYNPINSRDEIMVP